MQTLFKSNLFSNSSSKVGAKKFLSGGKKLGSSIVGAARNNIIGFNRTAQAMVPQKKEENENSFIKNYTNFFGSKKTEKILRKNLKLVRDSLVNTFEIARHLKAAIVSISKGLKGKGGAGGGGLFGGIKSFLAGALGGALVAALPVLLSIAAIGGLIAFGIALWKSPKFRKATLDFIKTSAEKIFEFLKDIIGNFIKAVVPKWIYNPVGFIRDVITGGDEFSKKHSQLDQRLKDAGMNTKGISENRSKQEIRHSKAGRTEEQEVIFQEVEAEREKLNDAKTNMNREVKTSVSDITSSRKPKEDQLKKEIQSLRPASKERVAKEKELRIYQAETRELKKEAKEKITSDANQKVSSPPPTVDGTQSNLNTLSFADSLKMAESGKNFITFEPITFGNASDEQSTSGGDVTSTSSGGTTGGDAVTFYSSSNPDSSYHKLNAMVTFNIV